MKGDKEHPTVTGFLFQGIQCPVQVDIVCLGGVAVTESGGIEHDAVAFRDIQLATYLLLLLRGVTIEDVVSGETNLPDVSMGRNPEIIFDGLCMKAAHRYKHVSHLRVLDASFLKCSLVFHVSTVAFGPRLTVWDIDELLGRLLKNAIRCLGIVDEDMGGGQLIYGPYTVKTDLSDGFRHFLLHVVDNPH